MYFIFHRIIFFYLSCIYNSKMNDLAENVTEGKVLVTLKGNWIQMLNFNFNLRGTNQDTGFFLSATHSRLFLETPNWV